MTTILDENRIPVAIGVSNADGTTLLPIKAMSATNSLMVSDGVGGTDKSTNSIDPRDENRKVAFFAVSAVDGVTPVAIYCDSTTNALLITSI